MSNSRDAVVIGAGHNGLTCACYLARAGMKVLVLEQFPSVGGMTNTEELTLPGYLSDTHAFAYQLGNVSPVPRELDLQQYGFELIHPQIGYTHVYPDGRSLSVHRDIEQSCASIARFSSRDAQTYRDRCARFAAQAKEFATVINSPPQSPVEQMTAQAAMPGDSTSTGSRFSRCAPGRRMASKASTAVHLLEPGAPMSVSRPMKWVERASHGASPRSSSSLATTW